MPIGAEDAKPPTPPAVIDLPARVSVGGGWSDAGTTADYIVGQDMKGKVAFTRKEVRINFDWGTLLPIGGSTAEPYKSFPHDNFSMHVTGKLIPRFTEPYTFVVQADGDTTLSLKDSTGVLKSLPLAPADKNSRTGEKKFSTQRVPLQSGTNYDLVLEYHHKTDAAYCSLSWSSPSTPEEVIDPVIEQGLNLTSYTSVLWADDTKSHRWGGKDDFDEKGDLKNSMGSYLFIESNLGSKGTYALTFTGKADVALHLFTGKLFVDGTEYKTLTAGGPAYDPAKNQTHALLEVDNDTGNFFLDFKNAVRDAAGTVPGITNLHIMRPVDIGSNEVPPDDTIIYPPMKRMIPYFTAIRWLESANTASTGHWADRTTADVIWFARPDLGLPAPAPQGLGGENWEYLIMVANETGRDLYLTIPMTADDDYFRKIAQLVRYGSDGVNPYTQVTANPKYPPLNPNLRVYYEVGNEIWNWAFKSTQDCRMLSEAAVKNNTDEGQIINYDGKANYRRFHAVRTVKASNIFREVFGDAAMGPRIRPLIEFQYTNAQDTANISYSFIEDYYNNADGNHVKDPHPVNYYAWGGGGAAYYGVGNGDGTQTDIVFKDSSFEEPVLADGAKSSDPGAWTFTGMAGIYRGLSSAVASYVPGPDKEITQAAKTGVGISFHTGAKPLWVYKLGRVYNSANDKGAKISILKAADKSVVTSGNTSSSFQFNERSSGYYWAELPDKKPVQLDPNTDYLLVSQDTGAPSRLNNDQTTIQPGAGLTNVKSIKVAMGDPDKTDTWTITEGAENHSAGPITMLYSESPSVASDYPQPPDGEQAAYLSGTGEISQDVNFPKAGSYAVTLNATLVGKPYSLVFQMFCDDQNASPPSQTNFRPGTAGFGVGGFARNMAFKEEWGSAVFTIDKPGPHKIRLVVTTKATDGSSSYVFDNLRITSADALLGSGFGSGSALGQPQEAAYGENQYKSSQYAWSFGLPRVSYETGWSVGGDFGQKPIQNWCKFMDPRSGTINDQAINILTKSGMFLPVWGVYIYFPFDDITHGETYPIMHSFIAASEKLPPDVDNGVSIPAVLTSDNAVRWQGYGKPPTTLTAPGTWTSWTIICPATGVYDVAVTNQAGGKLKLEADGILLGASGPGTDPSKYRVKMTKGIHGIRVANLEGSFDIPQVMVDPDPAK